MSRDPAYNAKPAIASMAGVAVLVACSPEPGMPVDSGGEMTSMEVSVPDVAASAVAEAERDCLLVVWEQQDEPNRDFDRAHDMVEGGLISCATGTSASQFDSAIRAIREAADSDDPASMLSQMEIPLLYIDENGERQELADTELSQSAFAAVLTPEMREQLRNLDLEDMTVVPEQGGFFALGAIWLGTSEPGGRPRLLTINRQALAEATSARPETTAAE
ncbi:hypothetical protein [Aurantiacibacter gangjinensis]|uniref:Uncharacterized protein n=1 Tax=Aurantiacibacter gangjinensis TaxID=502682 RepID=A0A0G9MPF1_9SPHN|nr:hypothetical protein [Aurantiacibacter gangjinensis]APE28370.1 hypothetical protein BMF35_a1541 [Aurantiacibacter gangjinensis]KLE32600.1 hypothetical protein AAW01_00575 [Aurantiacibacter gangjinensis]